MDAVSVMGEWDDDSEVGGTSGLGPLFSAVAGGGSGGALEGGDCCWCCGCGIFTVLHLFTDVGIFT